MKDNKKLLIQMAVACAVVLGSTMSAMSVYAEETDISDTVLAVGTDDETEETESDLPDGESEVDEDNGQSTETDDSEENAEETSDTAVENNENETPEDTSETEQAEEEATEEITDVKSQLFNLEVAKKYPKSAEIVYRFYTEALERQPEVTGFENWIKRVSEQNVTGADAAYRFFNCYEYILKFSKRTDEEYVDVVYAAVLGREPSESEKELMLRFLGFGVSRNYILRSLVMSQEYIDICSDADFTAGTFPLMDVRDYNFYATWFVSGVYKGILGRKFDENGLRSWVSKVINDNYTATDIVYCFVNSSEFKSKIKSDEDYVSAVYSFVLGREPEQDEVKKWTDAISYGHSRKYVLREIINSDSFTSLCYNRNMVRGSITSLPLSDTYPELGKFVRMLYTSLQREPSDAEVDEKIRQLQNGKKGPEMLMDFFSSEEYKSGRFNELHFVRTLANITTDGNINLEDVQSYFEKLDSGMSVEDIVAEVSKGDGFDAVCKKYGVDSGRYAYPMAVEALNKCGWDLRSAFNYAASIPYYGHTADMPQTAATSMEWYAEYGFKNGKGNCYVMAAMFCEMAKTLGYDAHQIGGYVPLASGGMGDHSWVEINIDGTTYVFDPDFTHETNRNGYMIFYGQSGTWRYVKDTYMS